MPFVEHLVEMRARILLCIFMIVGTTAAVWYRFDDLNYLVLGPLRTVYMELGENAGLDYPPRTFAVHEAFVYMLKMGFVAGIVLASPMIIYEVWAFVSPGLRPAEKRALIPVFWLGLIFFMGGAFVCYTWVLPTAVRYLVSINAWLGVSMTPRLRDYSSFVIGLMLSFGIAFEMPLVMSALARIGIVSPKNMLDRWRYAVLAAFVAGAFLTPPDYITQVMMAGCLIGLYGLGLLFAYMSYPGEQKEKE